MTPCLFCGGDPDAPDHWRHCDGRQGRIEALEIEPARPHGVTRSTAEAMAVLQAYRRKLIDAGRRIARQQIAQQGHTHSRAVLAAMEASGVFDETLPVKGFWLGAVFNTPEFEWTGRYYKYSDTDREKRRNIHERTVKVWRLSA